MSDIRNRLEQVCHQSLRRLADITLLQTFGKVIKADAGIVQVIFRRLVYQQFNRSVSCCQLATPMHERHRSGF